MEEDEDPDVVLCDGFADGFWPQRWAEEQAAPPAGTQARRKEVRGAGDAGMRDVWEAVTALRRERGAVVVLSVQGLRAS
jgi:hypothetical protein